MKKSLLSLLFVALMFSPLFALCGESLEIVPKIGLTYKPEITAKINGTNCRSLKDSGYCLGGDLYLDAGKSFFVGAGVMWGNNVNLFSGKTEDARYEHKIGFTNVYFTAKYKFEVAQKLNSPIIIYPLAQFGIGLPGWNTGRNIPLHNYEIEPGLYWGIGVGGEFKNIIIEFMYTCDYGKEKGYVSPNNEINRNFSYSAFRLLIGYKFTI